MTSVLAAVDHRLLLVGGTSCAARGRWRGGLTLTAVRLYVINASFHASF
eukprot:SAG25_NODE_14044_length_259_cov_18.068750_1_plen_48_part_10